MRGVRVLLIANPQATATSDRRRDVLMHALAGDADLQIEQTANRGHAAALACRAMRDGTDAVVALGGDGTVNEVVNGLLTDGVHERVPALGIVPTGSTNVFARALGLPNDPVEATGALLHALRANSTRPVSMTQADDRWFVFAAGFGYDAAVVGGVERHRRRGRRSTHMLYARVGLRQFFAEDRRHPKLHVHLPDGTVYDNVYFTIIANADPWTFAGNTPLRPTPGVTLESGLGLYARRRMSAAGLLISMARMAGSRPRIGTRGAYYQPDLTECVVWADEPMPFQVDGDYLGERTKVLFRSHPGAVRVLS